MQKKNTAEWLLLIHKIPPKPDYFRVKIWRKLQKIGAVAIKQSVYVLPNKDQAQEDMRWLVEEITSGGGTASLAKTVFIEGLSDTQVETLFHVARGVDYEKIVIDTLKLTNDSAESQIDNQSLLKKRKELSRIRHRFHEITAIDYCNAPGRIDAENLLSQCASLLEATEQRTSSAIWDLQHTLSRTWVSRKGINIDRIACSWLILRFIDPKGVLKFITDTKYQPLPDEIRFDMFEGEFTHIGDNCTFEVMLNAFGLKSTPLATMAEIIHDIDLKDNKFNRPETIGIQALFSGIAATHSEDTIRLERGSIVLDELYASYEAHQTT